MTIWIAQEAAHEMHALGDAFYPLEAGGVLLGWRDGADRIVAGVLGPGPNALHGRHAMVPDHEWQVAALKEAFHATGGDLNYLGDWHTHPDGILEMSARDRSTLTRIARKGRAPAMVITAGRLGSWRLGGWIAPRAPLWRATTIEDCEIRLFDIPEHWPRTISARARGTLI